MMEAGIHQRLCADAGFSAIASDRFFPVNLPEEMYDPDVFVPPSATYRVISDIPDETMDGATGMCTARIEINTWATVYGDAKQLARAIRTALNDFAGTLPDGTAVANLWAVSKGADSFDGGARLYRVQADYRVIYTE